MPKAQRTQGFENFDSFNTFSSKQKLQQILESLGKGRKVDKTLTNQFYNLEISIWVKILNQILSLMSYLEKSQHHLKKFDFEKSFSLGLKNLVSKKSLSLGLKKFGLKKVSVLVSKIFFLEKSLSISLENI